jgi:hypothetical protein
MHWCLRVDLVHRTLEILERAFVTLTLSPFLNASSPAPGDSSGFHPRQHLRTSVIGIGDGLPPGR